MSDGNSLAPPPPIRHRSSSHTTCPTFVPPSKPLPPSPARFTQPRPATTWASGSATRPTDATIPVSITSLPPGAPSSAPPPSSSAAPSSFRPRPLPAVPGATRRPPPPPRPTAALPPPPLHRLQREGANPAIGRAGSMMASTPEKKTKQQYAEAEILSTEQTYVKGLRELSCMFREPMGQSGKWSAQELNVLFSCSESLLQFHTEMLAAMEKNLGAGSGTICDALAKLLPYLKLYASYVNNYPEAQKLMQAFSSSQMQFLEENCGTESGLRGHLGLSILLGTPVQRIPRFVLLLRSLVKETPQEHPDYAKQRLLYENISVTASYINDQKLAAENRSRMKDLAERLTSDSGCPDLVESDDEEDPHEAGHATSLEHSWVPGASKLSEHLRCVVCNHRVFSLTGRNGQRCSKCQRVIHKHCRAALLAVPCVPPVTRASLDKDRGGTLILPHRHLNKEGASDHIAISKNQFARSQVSQKIEALLFLFNDSLAIIHPKADKYQLAGLVHWYCKSKRQALIIQEMGDRSLILEDPRPISETIHQLFFASPEACAEWKNAITTSCDAWVQCMQRRAEPTHSPRGAKPAAPQPNMVGARAFGATFVTPSLRINFQIPSIVKVIERDNPHKHFSAFIIEIHDRLRNGLSATLIKRFSQLWDLKSRIKRKITKEQYKSLEHFPPKKWFDNTDPTFVQHRCLQLQEWLNSLNRVPAIFEFKFFIAFFDPNSTVDTPLIPDEKPEDTEQHPQSSGTTTTLLQFSELSWDDILIPQGHSSAPSNPADSQSTSPSSSSSSTQPSRPLQNEDPLAKQSSSSSFFSEANPNFLTSSGRIDIARVSSALGNQKLNAVALYDFVAETSSELSVTKGDKVFVLESNGDWWFCQALSNQTYGFVPSTYLLLNLPSSFPPIPATPPPAPAASSDS